jgi:MFS superfamily sulfate permease-like transporter
MAYAAMADVPPTYSLYVSRAASALAVASGGSHLLFTGPVGVMTVLVLGSLRHFALTEGSRHQRHPAAVARSLASLPVT